MLKTELAKKIQSNWSSFFTDGKHYAVVTGKDLYDLKQIVKMSSKSEAILKGPAIMLLFEVGLNMIAIKSGKPEAIRLQEYVAEKVMPQLVRGGKFDPARKVDENGQLTTGNNTRSSAFI